MKQWTGQAGLSLHPEKTRLIDTATESFEFLGYRFDKGRRMPRHKSKLKLRETIRAYTPRKSGVSLGVDNRPDQPGAAGLVRLLQACPQRDHCAKWTDGCVMRLRSILRRRQHRRGRGRVPIINAGLTHSLPRLGSSRWIKPSIWHANP